MPRSMFVCAVFVLGCARGADNNGDALKADSPEHKDSSTAAQMDATSHSDAPAMGDASVSDAAPPPPDAAADAASALFCNDNAQCTNAGECCLMIGGAGICGKGVIVFGTCIPQ